LNPPIQNCRYLLRITTLSISVTWRIYFNCDMRSRAYRQGFNSFILCCLLLLKIRQGIRFGFCQPVGNRQSNDRGQNRCGPGGEHIEEKILYMLNTNPTIAVLNSMKRWYRLFSYRPRFAVIQTTPFRRFQGALKESHLQFIA
jgi:hypothetical protein